MVIWGIFWGGVLGWLWPGHEAWTFVGAVFGLLAGLSLRWVVNRRVNQQWQAAEAALGEKLSRQADWLETEIEKRLERRLSQSAIPVAADASAPLQSPAPIGQPAAEAAGAGSVPVVTSVPPSTGEAASELWSETIPDGLAAAAISESTANPALAGQARLPSAPTPLDQASAAVKGWLLGGNTIVRAGLVILFVGLSFLARYAASAGLLPVELRLAAIGGVGIALLLFGFRKRVEKPGFALALQGAGVAVMYLTVFAGFRLYDLLPPGLAFALMILICGFGCALALLQNSMALAMGAFAGGFAAPILLSTGQGSHVGLFTYYTVLNLAILVIAHQRSWRMLNLLGFVSTFGVGTAWGALKYLPEQYLSAQAFLAGFLLIYVFAAILYARNTPTQLGNAVDSTLVFGTPLVGFGLQAGLVRHMEMGTAFSALAFGATFIVLAAVLAKRARENYRLLIECYIALGVGFASLAVPLALDVRWTSAAWALEGAAAFWVGSRQARWMPRAFGLALQGVAALMYLGSAPVHLSSLPLLHPAFIGAMLVAGPMMLTAWWLREELAHSGSTWATRYSAIEARLGTPVYLSGFVFWCLAWLAEIHRHAPGSSEATAVLDGSAQQMVSMVALLLSAAGSLWLAERKQWLAPSWPARLSLVVMGLTLLAQWIGEHRVLYAPAWALWPLAMGLHYWMLYRTDAADQAADRAFASAAPGEPTASLPAQRRHWNVAMHVGGAWLITALLADCLWLWIDQGQLWNSSWASVILLISGVATLMLLATWAGRAHQADHRKSFQWPINPHALAYYWIAALPLALMVSGGALTIALHSSGRSDPLPYIPVLNPTDLTLALAIGALVFWRRVVVQSEPSIPAAAWLSSARCSAALVLLSFIAINSVWLRIAHHFFDVKWAAGALFASFVVQTGYAILWTVMALALMLMSHRQRLRERWLIGAGLLGVVVLKLFTIDLSNAGGAERIIAFVAVGVLMLVVGYFAPLPPKPNALSGSGKSGRAQPH